MHSPVLTPPEPRRTALLEIPRDGAAGAPGMSGEVSLLALLDVVRRRRRLVLGSALGAALLIVTLGLLRDRSWAADAAFYPQSRSGGGTMSALSGLAAQFGASGVTTDPAQSPAFYADLLRSRDILGAVVDAPLARPGGRTVAVADLLEVPEAEPAVRRERTIRALRERVDVTVSTKTGLLRMTVHAVDAAAAKALADRLLAELSRFNLQTRQSQAAAERRFIERRLEETRAESRRAGERLQGFLEGNRVAISPELMLTRDRLMREFEERQALVGTLVQSYERARMDEVRDTPVLTVVESPRLPALPEPRGLTKQGILALVAGALLGMVLAFVREFSGLRPEPAYGASGLGGDPLPARERLGELR